MAPQTPTVSQAAALAEAILQVGRAAHTEEDLRIGVEKLLEPALQQLGVVAQPRYERHIGRTVLTAPGRAESIPRSVLLDVQGPAGGSRHPQAPKRHHRCHLAQQRWA